MHKQVLLTERADLQCPVKCIQADGRDAARVGHVAAPITGGVACVHVEEGAGRIITPMGSITDRGLRLGGVVRTDGRLERANACIRTVLGGEPCVCPTRRLDEQCSPTQGDSQLDHVLTG